MRAMQLERDACGQRQQTASKRVPPGGGVMLTGGSCVPMLHCLMLSPSKTGFIVSVHRLINITLLTLAQATL